jgi:hypothetical protein
LKLVARVKKQISKFELTKEELGFVTVWLWAVNNNVSQKCKMTHG